MFHFFLYTPDADALKPLGERSLAVYIAALPYGDSILIVGPNESDGGLLELTRLSLEDGDTELIDSIKLDSALSLSNFAWNESQTLLYYTSNNTVWSLAPNAAEPPKVVGVLSEAPIPAARYPSRTQSKRRKPSPQKTPIPRNMTPTFCL